MSANNIDRYENVWVDDKKICEYTRI
jgi:hypothetical protein